MKCALCGTEMKQLQKGKPMTNSSMPKGSNVESIEYDIDYTKAEESIESIMNSNGVKIYITPETHFCNKCGWVSQRLSAGDLDTVKTLEEM